MEKKTFYVTTPIYYPSGKFHIGTAYTTILADTVKRYKKMRGYDTYFLTGLDEHGQKIEEVAKKQGKTPIEHVDHMADEAKKLWKLMEIEYDQFFRTTNKEHVEAVKKIFTRFVEQKDIYKGEYEGWYCVPCESYFTKTQLVDGKCPDCGREVRKMKEEAYFFNMKKYEKKLSDFYEKNPDFIQPEARKNEIFNNFIKPGLEDLCITRTSFNWGIEVPEDPKHVMYVWLDALLNYITALGYPNENEELFKKYWPADLQIVGKDIIRFHGIYWPIFLMALDLPLPKQIYSHGFIMMKDGKMSKSKGNVVYPEMLVEKYGLDATKYFLFREFPYGQDAVFTPESFVERFNSDLCNDLGNLLNRTIGMINKYFGGILEHYTEKDITKEEEEIDKSLILDRENVIKNAENAYDSYHISDALSCIWNFIARVNKYIDETKPWEIVKEKRLNRLTDIMLELVYSLRVISVLIRPCMKNTSQEILKQLGLEDISNWDEIKNEYRLPKNNRVIEKGEPLFVRLEKEVEVEYIKDKMRG